MNGCGGETLQVHVRGGSGDDYDSLVTKAMERATEFLPGCALQRRRTDCGGLGGFGADQDEWYIGCGHALISPGGTTLEATFVFIRHGTDES